MSGSSCTLGTVTFTSGAGQKAPALFEAGIASTLPRKRASVSTRMKNMVFDLLLLASIVAGRQTGQALELKCVELSVSDRMCNCVFRM